jgi:hypothetical protein
MGGTTTGGIPYVTPDDHPKEYPAASQALAAKIDELQAAVAAIPNVVSGRTGIQTAAAAASTTWNITFPAGSFTGPPNVIAQNSTGAGNDTGGEFSVHDITAAGCRIVATNRGTAVAGYVCTWVAVGR